VSLKLSDFESDAARVIRGEENSFAFILATHLMAAISPPDKLDKLLLILEASQLLEGTPETKAFVQRFYNVGLTLKAAKVDSSGCCRLPFIFRAGPNEYKAFCEPWAGVVPLKFPPGSRDDYSRFKKELSAMAEPWQQFFHWTTEIGIDAVSLASLRCAFVAFSMKFAMTVMDSVAKQVPLPAYLLTRAAGSGDSR